MNTSKTNRRSFRLAIAAVLALALVASLAIVIAVANTTPTVAANVTISLDGKVNLIFRFAEDNLLDGTTKFEAKIGDGEATEVKHTVEEGVYTVSVPLMPYEMTETVVINHLDANDTPIGTSDCSVVEYANAVLTSDAHSDYHSAVKALLNYGAMTQIDADKNTDNLANEGLYSWGNPVEAAMKPITVSGTESANLAESTVFDKDGCSVFLSFSEGDIALKYNITLKEGVSADDLMATIDGVGDVKPVAKGTAYEFEIRNLSVDTFSKIWTVKVTCGEEEFTTKHSVLEYLMWNIGTEDQTVTATQKDVCAALYQLYKHTAAKTSLEDCKHNNTGYGVATGTGVSDILCGMCNAVLAEDISDSITYIPEKAIAGANTWESVKAPASYVEEEYVNYVHYEQNADTTYGVDYVLLREKYEYKDNGGMGGDDGKLANKTINIGEAKYFVIRFRKTSDTNISIDLGSTAWTHENVETAANQGAILTSVSLETTNSTDWVTYVVDLGAFDQTKFGAVDGKRVVDTLKIAGFGNAVDNTGDIDFVAFVNNWSEVDALTPDATVQYIDADKKVGTHTTTFSSECPTGHINGNYDDKCDVCKTAVTDPGAYVLTGYDLGTNGTKTNISASVSDNKLNFTISSTTFEYIWLREAYFATADAYSAAGGANATLGTGTRSIPRIDIADAQYVMIKIKANAEKTITLSFGSEAYTGLDAAKETTPTWAQNGIYETALIKISQTEEIYVLHVDDINAIEDKNGNSGKFSADENGNRVIDSMKINQSGTWASGDTLSIAYIAFATDWAEVVSQAGGKVKLVNPTTGDATELEGDCTHNSGVSTTKEVDVKTIYTTKCATCKERMATRTVDTSKVLAYLDPATLVKQGTKPNTDDPISEKVSAGINYYSYENQNTNNGVQQVWYREQYSLKDGGTAGNYEAATTGANTSFNIGNSRYLVIKVKCSTACTLKQLYFSTSAYDFSDYVNKCNESQTTPSASAAKIAKQIDFSVDATDDTKGTLVAGEWKTFIVDLTTLKAPDGTPVFDSNNAESKTVDTFYFNMDSLKDAGTLDIAYIAFVETKDDATNIANYIVDTTVNE